MLGNRYVCLGMILTACFNFLSCFSLLAQGFLVRAVNVLHHFIEIKSGRYSNSYFIIVMDVVSRHNANEDELTFVNDATREVYYANKDEVLNINCDDTKAVQGCHQ